MMTRISCDTIRDILPLYVDEVVSDDTKNIVSEHLELCTECQEKYESMKKEMAIPAENSVRLLKKFKREWKRKKVVIVFSTIIATVAVLCLTLFIISHFAFKKEIAVNGAIYTQSGKNVTSLPAGSTQIGMLKGITFRSLSNPTEEFTATNLNEKYAGCELYQSGENEKIIYLVDYSGFYIPFELSEYIVQPERGE